MGLRITSDDLQFVLLTGDTSHIDFLLITLRRLWAEMAATSPNRQATTPIQLFRLNNMQDLVPTTLQRTTNSTQVSWREFQTLLGAFNVAKTAEAEQLVRILCEGALQTPYSGGAGRGESA